MPSRGGTSNHIQKSHATHPKYDIENPVCMCVGYKSSHESRHVYLRVLCMQVCEGVRTRGREVNVPRRVDPWLGLPSYPQHSKPLQSQVVQGSQFPSELAQTCLIPCMYGILRIKTTGPLMVLQEDTPPKPNKNFACRSRYKGVEGFCRCKADLLKYLAHLNPSL